MCNFVLFFSPSSSCARSAAGVCVRASDWGVETRWRRWRRRGRCGMSRAGIKRARRAEGLPTPNPSSPLGPHSTRLIPSRIGLTTPAALTRTHRTEFHCHVWQHNRQKYDAPAAVLPYNSTYHR